LSDVKKFHSDSVKKSIVVNASQKQVWNTISDITNLPKWIPIIKKTILKSKIKSGVGAVRTITFEDGSILEEHIVDWRKENSFSYIAVSGLPVRAYFATLSIQSLGKKSVRLTWAGYLSSKKITNREFKGLISEFNALYKVSIKNLKTLIER